MDWKFRFSNLSKKRGREERQPFKRCGTSFWLKKRKAIFFSLRMQLPLHFLNFSQRGKTFLSSKFPHRNSGFHSFFFSFPGIFFPSISIRNEFSLLSFIFILIPLRLKNSNIGTRAQTPRVQKRKLCARGLKKEGESQRYIFFPCGSIKTWEEIDFSLTYSLFYEEPSHRFHSFIFPQLEYMLIRMRVKDRNVTQTYVPV